MTQLATGRRGRVNQDGAMSRAFTGADSMRQAEPDEILAAIVGL
jgi:hypothetical protein